MRHRAARGVGALLDPAQFPLDHPGIVRGALVGHQLLKRPAMTRVFWGQKTELPMSFLGHLKPWGGEKLGEAGNRDIVWVLALSYFDIHTSEPNRRPWLETERMAMLRRRSLQGSESHIWIRGLAGCRVFVNVVRYSHHVAITGKAP